MQNSCHCLQPRTAFGLSVRNVQHAQRTVVEYLLAVQHAFAKLSSHPHADSEPRLYYFKVDIERCFDRIQQSTLIRILRPYFLVFNLHTHTNYIIYDIITSLVITLLNSYSSTSWEA